MAQTPVTEVVKMPLKPGTDLNDPKSPMVKVFQDTVNTVLSQPGAEGAHWGTEDGDLTTAHLFINWKSLDSHKQFMKSTGYQPFLKSFLGMLDSSPTGPYHFTPTPYPPVALSSTVSTTVELLHVHFGNPSLSSKTHSTYTQKFKQFSDALVQHAAGYKGAAGGFTCEGDILNPSTNTRGQAFVAAVGWESVQAHMKYRETEAFKEDIKLLRGEEVKGMEMVHFFPHDVGLGTSGMGQMRGDAQEEVLNPQGNKGAAPEARSDGTTTKKHHGWGT